MIDHIHTDVSEFEKAKEFYSRAAVRARGGAVEKTDSVDAAEFVSKLDVKLTDSFGPEAECAALALVQFGP